MFVHGHFTPFRYCSTGLPGWRQKFNAIHAFSLFLTSERESIALRVEIVPGASLLSGH